MLWPVGRKLGLRYTDYRTPWFIASVASMAGVPLTVGWIISTPFADQLTKHVAIVALISVVIGLFGVEVAHKGGFGKPVRMFFRPDLILGSNRILAGGLAALAIGMKFMFSNAPPGDTPVGNWYAFFMIIVLGLYQLIPLRGLIKLRTMVSRMVYDKYRGLGITALKEFYLIVGISLMLFAAHNFFGGVTPFSRNVLAGSSQGLAIMVISAAFVIIARSLYKRHIGDPFIKETIGQSLVKDVILAGGMSVYFYGYINVMVGRAVFNSGPSLYLSLIGLGLYLWGLILLIPLRAWARQNQKFGLMRQMVEVMLPSLNEELRSKVMGKVVYAVSELPEERRNKMVQDMATFVGEMNQADREKVMKTQMQVLSSLSPEKRMDMMKAMDRALLG